VFGFNLNANITQQCLVYEYAANGSLAGFFTDDVKRALLPAGNRLSIMFQLARAVHFLHTGGCKVSGKDWKVFHRDIKSANVCLADDFTPRLIDCGLAEFLSDDNSNAAVGSVSYGPPLGTPGYMCPEYLRKKGRGLPCPYIAAYDVYSIGVVLVELILGCLNGVQAMQNDTLFLLDLFEMYVQDEYHERIVDGWEKLVCDADPTIIWNRASLQLVCTAAIQCMAPRPEERLSTKELLDTLRDAILLNSEAGILRSEAVSAVDCGPCCAICNEYRSDIKCSAGHALCTACIVNKLGDDSGRQFLCLIDGCSSQPFQDEDLYGRIPFATYTRYVGKQAEMRIGTNVSYA
jgi:serine/threonine protein kinase